MAKSAFKVGLDLLSYIGIYSYAPVSGANALNMPTITSDDKEKVLTAINGALEEVYDNAQAEFKKQDRSVLCRVPATVTVALTENSTNATITGAESWMIGCTIQIAGDNYQNRIVALAGTTATLLYAWRTASATVSGTVYADAVKLGSDIKTVFDPVQIPPNRRLIKSQDKARFDGYSYDANHSQAPFTMINKAAGFPVYYYIDTFYDSSEAGIPTYMRFNPMPTGPLSVNFQAEIIPEVVELSDLFTAPSTDPNYNFTSIPAVWFDRVFLPICRQKFTSHPAFKNQQAKENIIADYNRAVAFLKGSQGTRDGGATRARYIC